MHPNSHNSGGTFNLPPGFIEQPLTNTPTQIITPKSFTMRNTLLVLGVILIITLIIKS